VDRNVSATARNKAHVRPANSLVTSPTYLLQKLEVPLPRSQTVTSGTNASSVYITTQGPHSFLSRGHLEPILRVQSCWCMKLTFNFQLYTSLRIYGVLPPLVRKNLFSQAQGQVHIFLAFIIYIFTVPSALNFSISFSSILLPFAHFPFYFGSSYFLVFVPFLTIFICPALNTSSVLALL
jgi:hypothetical protein